MRRDPLPGTPFLALLVFFAAVLAAPPRAQGRPIGFVEQFALADDRAAVLEQLVPGTEDYYYFHCIHYQHTGAFDQIDPLLRLWVQRHGRSTRVEEIEHRQALLTYDRAPAATLAYLRRKLDLRFDHQRQVPGQTPDLPDRLDPALLSRSALTRRALERHPRSLDGFRDSAFGFLIASNLDADRLHDLMGRLQRPDHPNLPALVVRDLGHRGSRGFGSLAIHRNLLLGQLEECLRLRPALLAEAPFVDVYLRRLLPGADVDWKFDADAREAYLQRLEAFVQRLPSAHNSLKAHVLHRRLAHDHARGVHDKQRFLAYLRLPRNAGYVEPKFLRSVPRGEQVADLARGFPTELGMVGNDEPLVRAYLAHFFRSEDGYETYAEFVREDYLKRLFAETRILAGQGDMERWYSLLDDPAYYEALRERVEIEFAPTQRRYFGGDDPVSIEVDLKNVGTLLVKVFEIDTFNFYTATGRAIDASIHLDGLVANQETTHEFEAPPLRRFRRTFDFPSLQRPGVYVVEFIGNGLSSRAVVQKGRLQSVERTGAGGHVFGVLDEAGRFLKDATIWMAGRNYQPDEDGEITIPFSSQPGMQTIVLRHGQLSVLDHFVHQGESYALDAAVLVDREALLSGRKAQIVVRPSLLVSGRGATVDLLEDPVLEIASVDRKGVASSQQVRPFALFDDRDSVHEIQVPEGLAHLSVTLRARIRHLGRSETIDLSSSTRDFTLSAIDATAQTRSAVLGRTANGYFLDVLGKNGEPSAERAVQLELAHRDFTDPVRVTLETDPHGRIHLGPLDDIVTVGAEGFPDGIGSWRLRPAARTYATRIHGSAAQTLRVPYQGRATSASRAVVSLLELRGGTFARDRLDHVAIRDGFVELRDLPPGDYDLWLKEADRHVQVGITAGEARDGWLVGRDRTLERGASWSLHITGIEADDEQVTIRLADAGPDARVHVVATRYLPPYDPFDHLLAPQPAAVTWLSTWHPDSSYHSGREIGDEYRYILERRLAAKFPGNMLPRPGLLLNPWALEATRTAIGEGGGAGGEFGGREGRRSGRGRSRGKGQAEQAATSPGIFPNFDFLPQPAAVLANLRPDADGVVRIPRADLGPGQLVHVLAVDGVSTVYTSRPLAERALEPADLRLTQALDPDAHFTEQRRIEFVGTGDEAIVADVTTSKLEVYDTLAGVYALFATLSGDADLRKFAFVLRWPQLDAKEKRALYSAHACHELHFFLAAKDPGFFEEVVRPYLANKLHKTFLDQWLLDDDLSRHLEPWAFAQLNTFERVLLARRLPARAAATARSLKERLELSPPSVERTRFLFESALKAGALGGEDQLGEELARAKKELARPAAPPRAPAPRTGAPGRDAPAEEMLEEEEPEVMDLELGLEDKMDRGEALRKLADEKSKDAGRRGEARALYRAPDPTREYVEHGYWHRRIAEQDADLIGVNAFWIDFAKAPVDAPFFSPHVAEASNSFAEMMLALAVLDLPFEAGEHASEIDGHRLSLRAASPLLLMRQEIEPSEPAAESTPILVSQDFFRLDDRYTYEDGQRVDKYVTGGEFLTDVVYGSQVVLTNPTSSTQELELLLQIPRGALPVLSGFFTRSVGAQLGAYSTTTVEYHFYFPRTGDYRQFPAHVSRKRELVAFAAPRSMKVVREPSQVDTTSWEHVSQNASTDEVLAFLDARNVLRLDLGRIAWRMRDRGFFEATLDALRDRQVYHETLWSYAIHHATVPAIREYLQNASGFLAACGRALESPLVVIDPVERRSYQHIEYEPLFNPRAHRFGRQRKILNASLARQHGSLLAILAARPRLDDEDWMSVTYYMLLQDRIEEALAAFARVDVARLPAQLQYDYMRAYLDFFSDDHAVARGIAERYRDHPVERWRLRFKEVLAQLDEAAGHKPAGDVPADQTGRQTALAASEPSLELEVLERRVIVRHRNLESCEIAYHEMDIEFLFSTSPFVQQGSGAFEYVRPNRADELSLPADGSDLVVDLPEEFTSSNVLVEVRGGGLVRRQVYYANALSVQMIENYGQLKVSHAETGRPLPKVYVKVFARQPGGSVRFHKDGYTDLRGRFDYASLSGEGAMGAERYAILVLSEEHGAEIREATPPKR